jgi:hypothetical protein
MEKVNSLQWINAHTHTTQKLKSEKLYRDSTQRGTTLIPATANCETLYPLQDATQIDQLWLARPTLAGLTRWSLTTSVLLLIVCHQVFVLPIIACSCSLMQILVCHQAIVATSALSVIVCREVGVHCFRRSDGNGVSAWFFFLIVCLTYLLLIRLAK